MAEGTQQVQPLEAGIPQGIAGKRSELDLLFSVTYEELRRLAASVRRSDPGATLSPTMLVNEAWLKLASSPPAAVASRLHFKRIAARAMRQVLVEAARRHSAEKRGADVAFVTFDEAVAASTPAGRLAAPEEIAAAVAFLVSDDAAYFVGATLSPNGGLVTAV